MTIQTSFAEKVSAHVDRSDALLDEIRRAAAYLRSWHGYTLWKMQEVTGLHKNSLLRLRDRDWMPKPETMVALARLVERAQAHRKGKKFEFPARRGPGRPPLHAKPIAVQPKPRAHGKARKARIQ